MERRYRAALPTGINLRYYQEEAVVDLRAALSQDNSALYCLPTGAGKSVIFSLIIQQAVSLNRRVWLGVERNELLNQAAGHMRKWGVKFQLIQGAGKENKLFNAHLFSAQTLVRRLDSIKYPPDLLIIDEAHHSASSMWAKIINKLENLNPDIKLIGVTATPERLDGKPLGFVLNDSGINVGGPFASLVEGPAISDLVSQGWLAAPRYFAPPFDSAELRVQRGEFSARESDAILRNKAIYGDAVDHYVRICPGQPALAFTVSTAAADVLATQFRGRGYKFEAVHSKVPKSILAKRFADFRSGQIHGLTSADMVIEGVDLPDVRCLLDLAPTLSRSRQRQKNGRGMRPSEGKSEYIHFDFVANVERHGHPLDVVTWNFARIKKHKSSMPGAEPSRFRHCPACRWYMLKSATACPACGAAITAHTPGPVQIAAQLEEKEAGLLPQVAPVNTANINEAIATARSNRDVKTLFNIAEDLGVKKPQWVWVYRKLVPESQIHTSITDLDLIRVHLKYKVGWTRKVAPIVGGRGESWHA